MNIPWDLIDGHLDDTLSDEEAGALRRWLAQDRGHLRVLARAAHDHAALADHFRRNAPAEGVKARPARPAPILRLPAVRWTALALAAGIVLVAGLLWLPSQAQHVLPELAAAAGTLLLERDGQARPADAGEPLQPGDVLRTSVHSSATLGYGAEATRVELRENTALKVLADDRGKQLQVLSGGVGLTVAKQPRGKPMRLVTPQAEVRVVGTRFNLFASPKSTRVSVTEGRVQLREAGEANPTELAAGFQAVVPSDGVIVTEPVLASHPAVQATSAPESPTGTLAVPPDGTGALLRETWFDVTGLTVADLLAHPAFPGSPSARDYPTSFETAEGGPQHDLYGSRWRGYLHAPVSGSYTFWIAADDAADLYLSPDDRPEARQLIARVPGYTLPREWTKFAEQESVAVRLEAGQRCFIEVLHKEQAGGDHVAVAWQLPGGEAEVIAGAYLSPVQP